METYEECMFAPLYAIVTPSLPLDNAESLHLWLQCDALNALSLGLVAHVSGDELC
ncbi:MAG: hypothetical protein KBS95_08865 [Alistipes sp.]|nr:hypothetical protein [Candidatus Alistipes equi]